MKILLFPKAKKRKENFYFSLGYVVIVNATDLCHRSSKDNWVASYTLYWNYFTIICLGASQSPWESCIGWLLMGARTSLRAWWWGRLEATFPLVRRLRRSMSNMTRMLLSFVPFYLPQCMLKCWKQRLHALGDCIWIAWHIDDLDITPLTENDKLHELKMACQEKELMSRNCFWKS